MTQKPREFGIQALYSYDAATGHIIRKRKSGRGKAGERAGCLRKDGRRDISYEGRAYPEHRVAWFLHYGRWPIGDVDHINGNPSDNRITNLREASRSQNLANAKIYANNKTGVRGVRRTKEGRYLATIQHQKQARYLGVFKTLDEAQAAYNDAALKLFGEFALAARIAPQLS